MLNLNWSFAQGCERKNPVCLRKSIMASDHIVPVGLMPDEMAQQHSNRRGAQPSSKRCLIVIGLSLISEM